MDAPAVLEEEKRSKSKGHCNVKHNTSVSGQQCLCHLRSEAELPKPSKKKNSWKARSHPFNLNN